MKNNNLIGNETDEPLIAHDGALIYELFKKKGLKIKNISVAIGFLKPGQIAIPHFHKKSEEIYYILSGAACVELDGKRYRVKAGNAIFIPIGATHFLENINKRRFLKIIAISSPPYQDKDIFFRRK